MARVHETEVERPEGSDPTLRVRLLSAVVAAPALSTVVVITATGTDAPVGAPPYWPWLLTSLQVLALSAIVQIHSFMADGSDRGDAGSETLDVQLYAARRR
jgi:hypothetical protein